MEEIWKDSSFAGYQVSNLGRVRHADRILNPYTCKTQRYACASAYSDACKFSKAGNRIPHRLWIHTEVARAFIGDRPLGLQVNHINGNKRDNRSDNLEYVTARENSLHAIRLGLSRTIAGDNNPSRISPEKFRGENNHGSKLNTEKVLAIRSRYGFGERLTPLAKEYGVTKQSIKAVVDRCSWRHI